MRARGGPGSGHGPPPSWNLDKKFRWHKAPIFRSGFQTFGNEKEGVGAPQVLPPCKNGRSRARPSGPKEPRSGGGMRAQTGAKSLFSISRRPLWGEGGKISLKVSQSILKGQSVSPHNTPGVSATSKHRHGLNVLGPPASFSTFMIPASIESQAEPAMPFLASNSFHYNLF